MIFSLRSIDGVAQGLKAIPRHSDVCEETLRLQKKKQRRSISEAGYSGHQQIITDSMACKFEDTRDLHTSTISCFPTYSMATSLSGICSKPEVPITRGSDLCFLRFGHLKTRHLKFDASLRLHYIYMPSKLPVLEYLSVSTCKASKASVIVAWQPQLESKQRVSAFAT